MFQRATAAAAECQSLLHVKWRSVPEQKHRRSNTRSFPSSPIWLSSVIFQGDRKTGKTTGEMVKYERCFGWKVTSRLSHTRLILAVDTEQKEKWTAWLRIFLGPFQSQKAAAAAAAVCRYFLEWFACVQKVHAGLVEQTRVWACGLTTRSFQSVAASAFHSFGMDHQTSRFFWRFFPSTDLMSTDLMLRIWGDRVGREPQETTGTVRWVTGGGGQVC